MKLRKLAIPRISEIFYKGHVLSLESFLVKVLQISRGVSFICNATLAVLYSTDREQMYVQYFEKGTAQYKYK